MPAVSAIRKTTTIISMRVKPELEEVSSFKFQVPSSKLKSQAKSSRHKNRITKKNLFKKRLSGFRLSLAT